MIGSVDYLEIWDCPGVAGIPSRPTKRTSPRPAMKLCATSSDSAAQESVHRGLCPSRPWRTSPTPGPRARTETSVHGQPSPGGLRHGCRLWSRTRPGPARSLRRPSEPALTRRSPDGTGAVLVDATLGAGGHAERFLTELPGAPADRARSRPRRHVDRRASGSPRSPTAYCWRAPGTTGSRVCSPNPVTGQANPATVKSTEFCSTSVCRRCNSTAPTGDSHTPSTRRWTCGWIRTRS